MSTVDFLSKIIDQSVGPILTAPCCREWRVFFFCWLKSYNSAVLPWKSIVFSANFNNTQLPWVPWIFWLKLLSSQVGQFSQHLAALNALVFLKLKCYNYAILRWKSILFSASFYGTQLPWVPWILCLKLLTSRLGYFSRHLAAMSAVFFFLTKVL